MTITVINFFFLENKLKKKSKNSEELMKLMKLYDTLRRCRREQT